MLLIDRFMSVVAPHTCIVCGDEGSLICKWCAPDAFPPLPSRCYRCQRISQDSATCSKCLRREAPRHVWVATNYELAAKELLRRFKFERTRVAATIVAAAMSSSLPYLRPGTLIVPIPTATVRIRQRGYDQAELLARQIAKHQQLSCLRAVSRLTQSRQVGANRQLRFAQLKDAFIVSRPSDIKGAHILLVDDVITTGATLETVTYILKQAGAKTVDAVVFAQKQLT